MLKNTGVNMKKKLRERIIPILIKHIILAGTAFFLASVMFILTMDMVVMPLYQRSGSELNAPNLLGVPVDRAKSLVEKMRLTLVVESHEYNNDYPENTISFQIPVKETIIKPGRRIRVTVSEGPKPLTVPDVVGKPPREARMKIQEEGLSFRDGGWIPSNDFPAGIVARQEPAEGEIVPDDTVVILYISNGKRETNIIMPNLVELSLSTALDTLKAYNFNISKVNVQHEEQSDLLPDTVIEQYPNPGIPTHTNDEVDIIVSTKPEKVK